jgi:alpha-L-fucosidase
MNGNWGYNRADKNFKSVEQLIGLLVETASKGGNLLLNVGPTSEGLIPEESVARLAAMGQWMQTHASAIRGTTGTPFDHTPYRVTRKGNTLNLFFQQWPADRDVLVPAFDRTPTRARMMGQREALALRTVDQGTVVRLPEKPSDAICSVVVLEG